MTDAREIIGHWPLRGYAPGGYICKCDGCGKTFEGDKRARQCLPCAATSAGFRILGPDDAKLIETALEHASFALDGVVALDDEDEGKDGGSDTCQHAKRTVDRALRALKEKRT